MLCISANILPNCLHRVCVASLSNLVEQREGSAGVTDLNRPLAKVCDGVARMSPVLLTVSGSTKGTDAEVLSHNFALTNGSVATLFAPPEGIPAERRERTVVDQTSWHSLPLCPGTFPKAARP